MVFVQREVRTRWLIELCTDEGLSQVHARGHRSVSWYDIRSHTLLAIR